MPTGLDRLEADVEAVCQRIYEEDEAWPTLRERRLIAIAIVQTLMPHAARPSGTIRAAGRIRAVGRSGIEILLPWTEETSVLAIACGGVMVSFVPCDFDHPHPEHPCGTDLSAMTHHPAQGGGS